MEKSQQKEFNRILKKAEVLEQKAQLDFDTALFLDNEVTKLEAILDNPETSPEGKELAMVKLNALHKRILLELNEESDSVELLEKEMNAFFKGLK
jgi:hypothetical protein